MCFDLKGCMRYALVKINYTNVAYLFSQVISVYVARAPSAMTDLISNYFIA